MKKILLIEDDDALRENISEMLILSNYSVVTARDGKSGVEAALREKPDLVLCDVVMPGLDGYGVLNILSRHPEVKKAPFVFLTGKGEADDLRKGLGMGADDYLVKPFHETELLDTLDLRLKKTEHTKYQTGNSEFALNSFTNFFFGNSDKPKANHEILRFKKNHVVFSENQRAQSVYYVRSGKLKEYRLHENGKELITNIYTDGDFIGHRAVLGGVNYAETVEVIDEAVLLTIPASEFIDLINSDMNLARLFLRLLSDEVQKKEVKLLNMAYNSLRKKVAAGLIEVADKFKITSNGLPVINLSREDLAHVFGSAQESMIRTLKEFKSEKLIDIQEGNIVILDSERLRNLPY